MSQMIAESWIVLCQLAPWLLLGMLLSGLLHVLLPANYVRRKFRGASGVVKAVFWGIPLPLCSCGVVPAGIGLKNQGASNGASVAFLISTPQTGVDSILVSASFFGWPFAIFKMVVAAITGIVGGLISDIGVREAENSVAEKDNAGSPESTQPGWKRCLDHGLEIVGSIWHWLLFGILVSAAIQVFVPQSVFEVMGGWGLLPSMLIVLFISTPLYVCATASVPIAAALVASGFPPAAALVFLMAGPATNVTTMGAIFGRFGRKTLVVYLVTIVVGSMVFAWMFDWLLTAQVQEHLGHDHDHNNWWSVASGVILLAMMIWFAVNDINRWLNQRRVRSAKSDKMTMKIEGMSCGNCVSKLETALKGVAGVESVSIDLPSGTATILGTPNLEDVGAKIRQLGFEAVSGLKS